VEVAGKTVIDKDGFILASSLPSLSITETGVVAGQTERLALDAQEGDLAIESDTDTTYVFGGGDPSVNDNWIKILSDPGIHGSTHEKGGSDELTTFGDTVHDSVSTIQLDSAISTPTDVGLSTNTEYENTSGAIKTVCVVFNTDGSQDISANIRFGPSGAPEIADELIKDAADLTSGDRLSLGPIVVPHGAFYQVTTFGSHAATIDKWLESDFL